ncbi:MAG: hypothetical protein H0X25_15580 [Acidobacteriales bacterium]|nr:hypothetical protein [Terriglobales bacterium]
MILTLAPCINMGISAGRAGAMENMFFDLKARASGGEFGREWISIFHASLLATEAL